MILDINGFIGRWPFWPLRVSGAAEVAEQMRQWGIERAAICSTRSLFVHCADGNAETAAACREYPQRFVGFACVGVADGPLDAYAAGFRGMRLYPQHHSYHPLYADFLDRMLEDAAARQWPVLLPLRTLMNWGMPQLDLGVMREVVVRHPGNRWILAGINYLHELEMALDLMRRCENVHLETSCIMGFQAISKIVDRCGFGRVLFGSAAPLQHGGAGLEKILRAKICEEAREAILGGNARRLLRLESDAAPAGAQPQ